MKDKVKSYYGKTLKRNTELKTNAACCGSDTVPDEYKEILALVDDEILARYYGCGSPLPPFINGCRILDLGCGAGRDVYLASKLVGAAGFVVGVDMTEEQLDVAVRHLPSQMEAFGYDEANVSFKLGEIENLAELGIEDNSLDVVISNCVINLSTDKGKVFREIFRVLKPGGELFFSDVFSDRRVPEHIRTDPVMYRECLGGTLYLGDFRRMMARLGYPDFRIVSKHKILIQDEVVKKKAADIGFYSLSLRGFKIEGLEDAQEDYGHTAEFLCPEGADKDVFELDMDNAFISCVPTYVSSNTAEILRQSRYAGYFNVEGSGDVHYGRFDQVDFEEKERRNTCSGSCCGSSGRQHE